MSIHGLIDQWAVGLGARFMPKYFREGYDSPTIREHLQGVTLEMPQIGGEGDYDVRATTGVGELHGAFRMARWMGESCPSIIYHHGASEIPFDYGFKRIFLLNRHQTPVNYFLVRAPFHRSMKEFQHGIRTLANVMAMLAVSVSLIERLVQLNMKLGVSQILVAGTSLGGFITNLHHIHYNSAHVYTPLLAGLAMHDAYLKSVYSRAVSAEAKENGTVIESILNFENDFAQTDHSNVFPLLARYDQLVRYEQQKASYGDCPVATINKGHTTGALSYKLLRRHVFRHLFTNMQISE
jgi:hypothetical protein